MKRIYLFILVLLFSFSALAQQSNPVQNFSYFNSLNVGKGQQVNTNSSAWLEIGNLHTTKCLLLSRADDTSSITSPVIGDFTFVLRDSSLYYFTNHWVKLSTGNSGGGGAGGNQTLSFTAPRTLSISGGNSVTLPFAAQAYCDSIFDNIYDTIAIFREVIASGTLGVTQAALNDTATDIRDYVSKNFYPLSNPDNYISTETDPLWQASPSYSITGTNISHWNIAYNNYPTNGAFNVSTGDVSIILRDNSFFSFNTDGRYLRTASFSTLTDVNLTSLANGQIPKYNSTSGKWENYTPSFITSESDPIFTASPSFGIKSSDIVHWNSAYGLLSVNGIFKGNGSSVSAATVGTDYSAGTSSLSTGILKTTTGTGNLSIAVAGDFPTLNQNTTGTADNVTGVVAIAHGGTGQTLANNAFNALAPSQTGNSGKFLTTNGSTTSWSTVTAGVSSVSNVDGTLDISPNTGNVVASLNLNNPNTWVGQQTFSSTPPILSGLNVNGGVLYTDASGLMQQTISAGTSTTVLHGGVNPSYSAISLSTDVTGTLPPSSIGALTGDVTSVAGSYATTLSNTGISAGSYNLLSVDIKGRATSGSYVVNPFRLPCRVATTGNLNAAYDNGVSSGQGATLINAGTQAALVVDGITLAFGNRVAVWKQTDPKQNGLYTVTTVGSGSTNWVLTRATDFDNSATGTIIQGATVDVALGTANQGLLLIQTSAAPVTLGVSDVVFIGNSANLSGAVTGVLPYGNGGTNSSTSYTPGSVIFAGATSFEQDNSNMYWDNTNKRMAIGGTTSPVAALDVRGVTGGVSNVGVVNVQQSWSSSVSPTAFKIAISDASSGSGLLFGAYAGGSGTTTRMTLDRSGNLVIGNSISNNNYWSSAVTSPLALRNQSGNSSSPNSDAISVFADRAATNQLTFTQASGINNALALYPRYNQTSGTAVNTDILLNRLQVAVGSGAQYLMDLQVSGTSKFRIDNTGIGYVSSKLLLGSTTDDGVNALQVTGSTTTNGLTVNTGVSQGSGIKHVRQTTGSISAGSSSLVTVTWGSAFANSSYTVVASVLDATASVSALSVVHVESQTASTVTVRVQNTSAGSLTGTLQLIAMHD